MGRRLLDIGEGKLAICLGHAVDLIKASKRVPHMARVGERLFAMARIGVHAIRQITAGGRITMLNVGHPSRLYGHLLGSSTFSFLAPPIYSQCEAAVRQNV